ncbi:sensor histidine kinase [Vibrio tapetis]|uniref:ATP-binding protein n=1 Tax=Vibrio tapetis TaxID=52443 RepID=UPI000C821611
MVIEISQEDGQINIVYIDNGKGINENDLSKIFDPFFTTNRNQGGTGLGLNIIYNIITSKLKGKINCTSELEKGVNFEITVPIQLDPNRTIE